MGIGLDIGTNMLVSAMLNEENDPVYRKQRDAFYRIRPKSKINAKSIRASLENRNANFIVDGDDFVVVGEDALNMANDRMDNARRPMSQGVLSPKEKDAIPMMKLLLKSLISDGNQGDLLVFSVPGDPADGEFDIHFHTEAVKKYITEMGFEPEPMNEAFAIAFSELLDDNLTGACLSFGAGMVNLAVCYEGDPVVQFSITRGGDWIDKSVAKAVNNTPSAIQLEKESPDIDLMNPSDRTQEAISVYYGVLMDYAIDYINHELGKASLPNFREPLPIILSGGLMLANGSVKKFNESLSNKNLPFAVKEVRRAKDPMTCVAHGCLMAAIM